MIKKSCKINDTFKSNIDDSHLNLGKYFILEKNILCSQLKIIKNNENNLVKNNSKDEFKSLALKMLILNLFVKKYRQDITIFRW
ncbi:MAG: hypothetical protein ACTSPY_05805 [Candidatus Helarchaeota archaeon]